MNNDNYDVFKQQYITNYVPCQVPDTTMGPITIRPRDHDRLV